MRCIIYRTSKQTPPLPQASLEEVETYETLLTHHSFVDVPEIQEQYTEAFERQVNQFYAEGYDHDLLDMGYNTSGRVLYKGERYPLRTKNYALSRKRKHTLWVIEISSLEDLKKIFKETEVVLTYHPPVTMLFGQARYPEGLILEIYDDYRE